MRLLVKLAAVAALSIAVSVPARAATVLFNFGSSSGQADYGVVSSNNGARDGNGRVYSASSGSTTVNVRATGWSIEGNMVRDSFLGAFSGGLGVTSGDEVSGGSNTHTVDNQNRIDFVILQFDQNVSLDSAVFNAFKLGNNNYKDNDATIGFASTNLTWNNASQLSNLLNNQNVTIFNALIPVANRYGSAGTGTSAVRSIGSGSNAGNIWLVSAAFDAHNPDGKRDAFKFNTLTARTAAPVPEPATWAMMMVGFGFAGWGLRRAKPMRAATAA